eukprot:2647655-Pleurochrysis_carterae.AAC.1
MAANACCGCLETCVETLPTEAHAQMPGGSNRAQPSQLVLLSGEGMRANYAHDMRTENLGGASGGFERCASLCSPFVRACSNSGFGRVWSVLPRWWHSPS